MVWLDSEGYIAAETLIVSGKPYTVRQFTQLMLRRGASIAGRGGAYAGSALVGWSIGEAINAHKPHPCGPTIGESIQENLGFNSFWSWYYSTPNPVVSEWDREIADFEAIDRRMSATDTQGWERADAYRRYKQTQRLGVPSG